MVQITCLDLFYLAFSGFEVCKKYLFAFGLPFTDYPDIAIEYLKLIVVSGNYYRLVLVEPFRFGFESFYLSGKVILNFLIVFRYTVTILPCHA